MLEATLQALRVTDAPPSWRELTAGESDVSGQTAAIAPQHFPVLTEILSASWEELDGRERQDLTQLLAARLVEIDDPVGFASSTDRLTAAAVALGGAAASALEQALLDLLVADCAAAGDVRARFALGACTDLVCFGAVTPYRLQATLDAFAAALPTALGAPVARAAGRLGEQREDPLYERLLTAALGVEDAVSDASLELGHARLRDAAIGDSVEQSLAAARAFYRDADAADESRPDAVAFGAAIDLLTGFAGGAGSEALGATADEMKRAAGELRLFATEDAPSRTLAHIGEWLEFASRIRTAAAVLELRGVLDLREALGALLDLYRDARTRMLGQHGDGIATLIEPRVERWFAANRVSRAALTQLAGGLPAGQLRDAAERLLAVADDDPKAQWSRCRPASPGCSELRDFRRPTPSRLWPR